MFYIRSKQVFGFSDIKNPDVRKRNQGSKNITLKITLPQNLRLFQTHVLGALAD